MKAANWQLFCLNLFDETNQYTPVSIMYSLACIFYMGGHWDIQ